jgi:hypothetical protein
MAHICDLPFKPFVQENQIMKTWASKGSNNEENATIVPWILVMHKCVVDVKFNSCRIFHFTITIDLYFTCIYSLFLL